MNDILPEQTPHLANDFEDCTRRVLSSYGYRLGCQIVRANQNYWRSAGEVTDIVDAMNRQRLTTENGDSLTLPSRSGWFVRGLCERWTGPSTKFNASISGPMFHWLSAHRRGVIGSFTTGVETLAWWGPDVDARTNLA